MSTEEEERLEELCSPLLDLFLKFEKAFARIAIERIGLTDEEAEAYARMMEADDTEAGKVYGYLLRHVRTERTLRKMAHMASAVWASDPEAPRMLSFGEVAARYGKIPKGDA